MQIKPQTLMVSIQSVAAQIKSMDRQLQECESSNAAALEQILLSYEVAAADLEKAYREALTQYGNFPPYEELVKPFEND
jgi:predicted helicase